MNDLQLAGLIIAQLKPVMLTTAGLTAAALLRNFQPRQQGAPSGPAVFFFKVGDKRYGSPQRRDLVDGTGLVFGHEERQLLETTWQFSAWIQQDPADAARLTESDVLNLVSGIMQSDTIIAGFRTAGVGIQRVTDVRNPYIVDDRDRFEAVPSFDIVVTHYRVTSTTVPAVVAYDANVSRV